MSGCSKGQKDQQAVMTAPADVIADIPGAPEAGNAPTGSNTIPAGATIPVRLNETLDSDASVTGTFVTGTAAEDIPGPNGKLAVAAGSPVLMVVTTSGKVGQESRLGLLIYSVTAGGKQHRIATTTDGSARFELTHDSGDNLHRTVHVEGKSIINFKTSKEIDF